MTSVAPQVSAFSLLWDVGVGYFHKVKYDPSLYLILFLPLTQQFEKRSNRPHFWRNLNNCLYLALATYSFHNMLLYYTNTTNQLCRIFLASGACFRLYQNQKHALDFTIEQQKREFEKSLKEFGEEKNKEIQDLNDQIAGLEQVVRDKDQEISKLNADLKAAKEALKDAQNDILKLKSEKEGLQERLKTFKNVSDKREETLIMQEQRLAEQGVELQSLRDSTVDCKRLLAEKEKELNDLKHKWKSLKEVRKHLNQSRIALNQGLTVINPLIDHKE